VEAALEAYPILDYRGREGKAGLISAIPAILPGEKLVNI
jgi:hypothetical protein